MSPELVAVLSPIYWGLLAYILYKIMKWLDMRDERKGKL